MAIVELLIATGGVARCIYAEEIDLHALGVVDIKRASHVEPNKDGHWTADLSPVDGPQLGPFDTRTEALAAEVAWLHEFWLQPHCD